MRTFLKVYPKTMQVMLKKQILSVKLPYAVEQYGMLTGPFDIVVNFHPEMLQDGVDPWEIIMNTKPLYNKVFDNFFTSLEVYLREYLGIQPIEDVRSGAKNHFDMYFPEIHYDFEQKAFEKTQAKKKPFEYR